MTPDPEQTLIVATSGGKDSAAMALWLKYESGLPNPMRFVFNDTGHESEITRKWMAGPLAVALKVDSIETTPAKYTFRSLAVQKGRFPSIRRRFCTEQLKVLPMQRWMEDEISGGSMVRPVLCQGVRAAESLRRSKMAEWDNTGGDFNGFYDVWRPILRWSVDDVFAIHGRYDLEPNPLYKKGVGRVGCWPCIYVNNRELKAMFRLDNGLLPALKEMEEDVERVAIIKARTDGTDPGPTSLFYGKIPDHACDRTYTKRSTGEDARYPSIQAVHDYLMNPDQADMFADEEGDLADVPTCMSQYGLCE